MALLSSNKRDLVPKTQFIFIPITNPSPQRGRFVKYGYKIYNPTPFAQDPINNPPLILANGWTATKEDFYDLPSQLIKKSNNQRTIITIDHRGIGESIIYYNGDVTSHQRSKVAKEKKLRKPIPKFTLEDLADDIAYLTQHLYNKHEQFDRICKTMDGYSIGNCFKVDLLGMSMGGMIAQLFGLRYPQYTRNLILFATAPAGGKHTPSRGPKNKEFFQLSISLPKAKSKEEMYAIGYKLYELNLADPLSEEDRNKIPEMIRISQITRRPSQTIMGQANAIFTFDNLNNLSKMGNSKDCSFCTLIFHGTKDNILDFGNGQRLANDIKNNIFVELKNQGHLLYATRKGLKIAVECVDEFLNIKGKDKRLNLDKLQQAVGNDSFVVTYNQQLSAKL